MVLLITEREFIHSLDPHSFGFLSAHTFSQWVILTTLSPFGSQQLGQDCVCPRGVIDLSPHL